ncbi:DUF654-domain-containing protein [Neolentinus lepideus HHB14362 ss-1]|uniref:DUF654-domain-containing protein n=1 Tax=Neolentinus lepideus HHB14362 ss-1 TaxID=1314782 RepID=A0A165R1I8_9AGAM|nr:DUF654-domain-containing protein [Neolentinus lepideus HHB14362 ss-1]
MPPRLNKRQQRELEELSALGGTANVEEDASSEDGVKAQPKPENDEDDSDEGEESVARPKSKKKKKKKAGGASASIATPAIPTPETASPAPGPSKKDRKAAKKAKAKGRDVDEIDRVLEELSIRYPDMKTASEPSSYTSSVSFSSLLSINSAHLDPNAELRRLFGSKVVPSASSKSKVRSTLTRPKDGWWPAKLREGLSLRALDDAEAEAKRTRWGWQVERDEKWHTVVYDKRYRSVTAGFVTTVMAGDPEGFWRILSKFPYQADTLLQLAETYRYRDGEVSSSEHAQATDFAERALFAYERAFTGTNFMSGVNRLDFDRVENRPFFLAVHRLILDLQRRGCPRTAFEFAKLLYSLDPAADPHGALLHLDSLAVKAGGTDWLIEVYDFFNDMKKVSELEGRMDPSVLPGWMYSRALALRMKEYANKSEDHGRSDSALQDAVCAFPSVVPLLADKADIALSSEVRSHRFFRVQTGSNVQAENVAYLLSHLYALRASALWKQNSAYGSWIAHTAQSLLSNPTDTKPSKFATLFSAPTLAYSVYRHVIILESSSPTYRSLFSFLPREALAGPGRQLACDPLPPPTKVSGYDEKYFEGVSAWEEGAGRRDRREEERVRRYIQQFSSLRAAMVWQQAILDANPQLAQQFPGGWAQLLQTAAQMGEGGLEDLIFNVAQEMPGAGAGLEMPGGMPEVEMQFLDEIEEDGQEETAEVPARDDDQGEAEEEEEDDEGEEVNVASTPVRFIRNFMTRLWGGWAADEEDDESTLSDEDDGRPVRGGDVD